MTKFVGWWICRLPNCRWRKCMWRNCRWQKILPLPWCSVTSRGVLGCVVVGHGCWCSYNQINIAFHLWYSFNTKPQNFSGTLCHFKNRNSPSSEGEGDCTPHKKTPLFPGGWGGVVEGASDSPLLNPWSATEIHYPNLYWYFQLNYNKNKRFLLENYF